MKTKTFDLSCPGCYERLKFTLRQTMSRSPGEREAPRMRWPRTEMVRCQSCGGVATLAIDATPDDPDDPHVVVTKFVKLTRG